MTRNVGPNERYVRLGAGAAAAFAAATSSGWQRALFGTLAAAGIATGVTGYCPMNKAVGRQAADEPPTRFEGERDTELRRETAMRGALGSTPSGGGASPAVRPEDDVFARPDPRPM